MGKFEWNRLGFSISPVDPGWPIEYGLGMMHLLAPSSLTPFRPFPEIIGHAGVSRLMALLLASSVVM